MDETVDECEEEHCRGWWRELSAITLLDAAELTHVVSGAPR